MKFGVDKRKAHLTNLIYSGQITKQQALAELESPPLSPELVAQDLEFVTKKLGLSSSEFEVIMHNAPRAHQEFEIERSVYDMYPYLRPIKSIINLAKKAV